MIIRSDKSIDAYLLLGQKQNFKVVGEVFVKNSSDCSCVAIDPYHVITAAHCLFIPTRKTTEVTVGERTYRVKNAIHNELVAPEKLKIRFEKKKLKVASLVVHPDFDEYNPTYDVAILTMEEPLENMDFPVINEVKDELNDTVYLVGWGVIANDKFSLDYRENKKVGVMNVIDSCGNVYGFQHKDAHIFTDFDRPGWERYNISGNTKPLELEGTATGGDSGGGIFRMKNGATELIGIISGNKVMNQIKINDTLYYNYLQFGTRTSYCKDWIHENLK